jgi:hypothetical protein
VPGTNKHFLPHQGCCTRAAAIYHLPHQPHRPSARQLVLFGRCLLADIAFKALAASHWNRIAYWIHKVSASCAPFFCHSVPELATLKFSSLTSYVAKKNFRLHMSTIDQHPPAPPPRTAEEAKNEQGTFKYGACGSGSAAEGSATGFSPPNQGPCFAHIY